MTQSIIPADFLPNDSDREWSFEHFQCERLPDVFLTDFRDHHEAKGTRMADWHKALKNWIRWASPGGRFYNASEWEKKLAAAKGPLRKRVHRYDPRGREQPANIRTISTLGRAALERMRGKA